MTKKRATGILALVLATLSTGLGARAAHAQEPAVEAAGGDGGIGVGAEIMLTGAQGALFVYDSGTFHIDGLLGVLSNGGSEFLLGGRFFFEVHEAQAADFSVGGGIGIVNVDPDGPADSETNVHVEGGAQIRVWLVPNVAFSTSVGLGFVVTDGDDAFVFNGLVTGAAGIAYYFR